jgi:hypothetical protein
MAATYPIMLVTVVPEQTVAEQDRWYGPRLYSRDPDKCCALRKVSPLDGVGAHPPRGRGGVRAAGAAVLRRQGLDGDAAPGRQGLHPGADSVSLVTWTPGTISRRHWNSATARWPLRRAAAGRRRPVLHRRRRAEGTSRRDLQSTADPAAAAGHRGQQVRRRARRRPPRRGEDPGQRTGFLAARRLRPVGPAPAAAGAVAAVQRAAPAGRTRARVSPVELDRAGRLGLHPGRAHRAAGDLLQPPAIGLPAQRHVARAGT